MNMKPPTTLSAADLDRCPNCKSCDVNIRCHTCNSLLYMIYKGMNGDEFIMNSFIECPKCPTILSPFDAECPKCHWEQYTPFMSIKLSEGGPAPASARLRRPFKKDNPVYSDEALYASAASVLQREYFKIRREGETNSIYTLRVHVKKTPDPQIPDSPPHLVIVVLVGEIPDTFLKRFEPQLLDMLDISGTTYKAQVQSLKSLLALLNHKPSCLLSSLELPAYQESLKTGPVKIYVSSLPAAEKKHVKKLEAFLKMMALEVGTEIVRHEAFQNDTNPTPERDTLYQDGYIAVSKSAPKRFLIYNQSQYEGNVLLDIFKDEIAKNENRARGAAIF